MVSKLSIMLYWGRLQRVMAWPVRSQTFTATRVKCYFETGGAVWCKGGVEVLRVGHYDGWKMTALIRLVRVLRCSRPENAFGIAIPIGAG